MSLEAEKLLETVLDLERTRQRERELRLETEALLNGLHHITASHERDDLFQALVRVLHTILDFEDAFILEMNDDGQMSLFEATSHLLDGAVWEPGSVFKRALEGGPVACFNVELVPEWARQPVSIRKRIRSALHIGLKGVYHQAILIVTHSEPKHFGPTHVRKAKRFAPLASQALVTLELQHAILQRNRFFQLSMDLMGIMDERGMFKQFNSGWKTLLGYNPHQLRAYSLYDLIHEEEFDAFKATIRHIYQTGDKQLIEARFKDERGNYLWLSCSLAAYMDEKLFYIVARDVTEKIVFEQYLKYEASHDGLTGLYNRGEFMERIGNSFARLKSMPDYRFAILYLDLDKFKTINDTMGHDVGDRLLQKFAESLLSVVRSIDSVGRLGGDEFAILLENAKSHEDAVIVALRIHEKLANPFTIMDHEIFSSTSIGISMSSSKYRNVDEMLRDADTAMYKAKSSGKLQYAIAKQP